MEEKVPSGKLTWQWNISIFNRKYIFNPGPFSIAMLDYRSVQEVLNRSTKNVANASKHQPSGRDWLPEKVMMGFSGW